MFEALCVSQYKPTPPQEIIYCHVTQILGKFSKTYPKNDLRHEMTCRVASDNECKLELCCLMR